jgi:hypothetical protein
MENKMEHNLKNTALNILIHSAECFLQRNYPTISKPDLELYKYDCQSLIDNKPGTAIRLYFGKIELTFKNCQLYIDQRTLNSIPHETCSDFHSDHVQGCLETIELLLSN